MELLREAIIFAGDSPALPLLASSASEEAAKNRIIYTVQFNDENFNGSQVSLLQTTFEVSVRNPLENFLQNAEKGLTASANPL